MPAASDSASDLSDDNSELQFDLYARYIQLAEIVRAVSQPSSASRLIDVGAGFSELTGRFLPGHFGTIVRTDVDDFGDTGITVVPPGAPLPFADGAFDCAIAMDVLEHVPQDGRRHILAECVRVAPRLAIVATPLGCEAVEAAEQIYAAGYRHLFDRDLAFLQEHAEFGLPHPDRVAALVADIGATLVTVDNVRLSDWLASNLIDLYGSTINDGGAAKRFLARRVTKSLPVAGGDGQHYRRFYVMTRDESVARQLREMLAKRSSPGAAPDAILQFAVQFRDYVAAYDAPFIDEERADLRRKIDDANDIVAAKDDYIDGLGKELAARERHIQALDGEIAAKQRHIEGLEGVIAAKDSHIAKLDALLAKLSAPNGK